MYAHSLAFTQMYAIHNLWDKETKYLNAYSTHTTLWKPKCL